MPTRHISVGRRIYKHSLPCSVSRVQPPVETVIARASGSDIFRPADGPLTRKHVGINAACQWNARRNRSGNGHLNKFRLHDLLLAPLATAQIQQPKPREVAARNGETSR